MAGAEVTVSSGDLMMLKEEEGEASGSNHKTQVILHLQPILHGVNDDIADTGTTVLAIETHHEDSKAEGEEIEYGYPITCGDSRAVLLFKKFVCPGINVRCVKFNDQLISPKQFVHLAGKATLKDWKRAIRLGGVMLRKMMDSGQIDFYQHDTVCSNTCRSTKFDVLINSTRLPPGTSVQPSPSCLPLNPLGGQVPPLTGEVVHDAAEIDDPLEEKFSATAEWSPSGARPVNPTTANGHAAKRKRADTPDAAMLNSLCKMFGLLDSVKQALNLKRSKDEENKIHHNVYVLDDILEDQRKQGYDKCPSYKIHSLKHLRQQRHNQLNLLSPVKTSPGIQPLSVTGLSAGSYAQLAINPQVFTHSFASTGRGYRAGAGRTDRDGQSAGMKREQEISDMENQQKCHRQGQEESSGIHKEPGQRTIKFQKGPHLNREEKEEAEELHDIEKVVIGGKVSKKHKSK
uniref:glucocorticoid modulatory element-binding protein 1-like isoform X2 n=1 Tax=Semicossyphus pulcher TaxID=241346 RepID=UPI0037E85C24